MNFEVDGGYTLPSITDIDDLEKINNEHLFSDFTYITGACIIVKEYWYLYQENVFNGISVVPNMRFPDFFQHVHPNSCDGGVRPGLPFSNISDFSIKEIGYENGILLVEYGEYPQFAVDSSLGKILDIEFSENRLRKTGKTYTTYANEIVGRTTLYFYPDEHEEFEYQGKKYVRVKANHWFSDYLKNININKGDYLWLEVSPIIWYVDESAKLLISKKCLVSGIPYCGQDKDVGEFKNTEIYNYLNTCFATDIIPSGVQIAPEKKATYDKIRQTMLERHTKWKKHAEIEIQAAIERQAERENLEKKLRRVYF